MSATYDLVRGDGPILIGSPHGGTEVPEAIRARLTDEGLRLPDTDWHVPRLYDFAGEFRATVIAARLSRYVVDLNRPPTGESLYPGQTNTGLVPTATFDGDSLYRDGREPDAAEVEMRVATYWRPYHAALAAELARIKARFGFAILYDAHSIRSRVPRLFEGRLPDFNLGTNRGASCDRTLEAEVTDSVAEAAEDAGFCWVLNGRFVGGYVTRAYGRPTDGVHAVQMEEAQLTYMDEAWPFVFREEKARRARPVLRAALAGLAAWAEARAGG